MNNKGFTIVEVLIAFILLAAILLSLISFSVTYRDKVREEEVRTQLNDYKNMLTKIIYDDIILQNITSISKCDGQVDGNITCVNFTNSKGDSYKLEMLSLSENTANLKKGMYLNYNGVNYMLPDSDLNKTDEKMCAFYDAFELTNYEDIYALKISYKHYSMDDVYVISLVVN